MNFTVTRESGVVIVTVSLPHLQRDKVTRLDTNRMVLRENHVRDYLNKSNISVGECLQIDNIDNMGDRLTAVWKFSTLSEKTLDKPPSNVISFNSENNEVAPIPEEETKADAPKAKRRRRKTTTKKEG